MPIHDLGYRHWQGERSGERQRWWVIAQTGGKLGKNQYLARRLVAMAWLPALVFALAFAGMEQIAKMPELLQNTFPGQTRRQGPPDSPISAMAMGMVFSIVSREQMPADVDAMREMVWLRVFSIIARYVHGIAIVLIVATLAPPLISQDVRSRAFLIYFSRPVTRGEYILGKMGTVAMFLFWATVVPALGLYVLGVALAPGFGVVLATWDIPLRILLSAAVLIIPATAVSLALSSITTDSRVASFAWLALWGFGATAYTIIWNTIRQEKSWLSPFHMFSEVQKWIFGVHSNVSAVSTELTILAVATGVSLLILFNRVSAPMRV